MRCKRAAAPWGARTDGRPDPLNVVVIGANMAGGRAVEALRTGGFDGGIQLVGDEAIQPYERPPMSKEVLRGEWPVSKAFLRKEGWYDDNAIELVLNVRAERVDVHERTASLSNGRTLRWDKLLLCTGGRPRRLNVPGGDTPGVFTLRTADDSIRINEHLKPGARIVVIGAGFIGAEVAASARTLGCEVAVVELFDVPLKRVLGDDIGRIYADIHREHGVALHLGTNVARIVGDHWVQAVELTDGTRLDADAVIVGVGIDPNVEMAQDAGIECDNGIVVNEHCETSAP